MATDKRFVAKNGLNNNNQTITNVATPVNEDDVAIKSYVDAEDANAVKLTGDQTIAGTKTFSNEIYCDRVVPNGSNALNNDTLVGKNAGANTTNTSYTTLVGANAGYSIADTDYSVALGDEALSYSRYAGSNVAVGSYSLRNVQSSDNVAIGFYSLGSGGPLYNNTVVGSNAGASLSGDYQTHFISGAGSGYIDGTYTNVSLNIIDSNNSSQITEQLEGDIWRAPKATITVSGGAVTNVVITYNGYGYPDGIYLSTSNTNLGGAGSGFRVRIFLDWVYDNVLLGTSSASSLSYGHSNIVIGSDAANNLFKGNNNIVIASNSGTSGNYVDNEITIGNGSNNRFRIPGLSIDWTNTTTVWTNSNDGSGSGLNADLLDGIHAEQLFNNHGETHSTRSSFDATTPSYGFGFRYIQGSLNGPGTGGGASGQYYSLYTGLGSQYPATGAGSYGMYVAIDRNSTVPYLSVRYNEGNSLSAWYKINAGGADKLTTARNITIGNVSRSFNGSSDITWSTADLASDFLINSDNSTNYKYRIVQKSKQVDINAPGDWFELAQINMPGAIGVIHIALSLLGNGVQITKYYVLPISYNMGGQTGIWTKAAPLTSSGVYEIGIAAKADLEVFCVSGGLHNFRVRFTDAPNLGSGGWNTGLHIDYTFETYCSSSISSYADLSGQGNTIGVLPYCHLSVVSQEDEVLKVKDNLVWHAGNDGSGSGLEADLLDGYDSSLEVVGGTSTIPIRTSSGLMYIYKIVAPNNDLLLRGGGDQVGNALLNLENSGSIQITSSTLLNSDVVISAPVGRVIIDGVTVGYGGNSSPTDSVGIGVNALLNNTGNNNVAVGQNAAVANTSGWDITAVGQSALTSNTTGTMNTAVGRNALRTNSIGTSNVAVGRRALYSSTASYNVAVGADASHAGTTGTNNSAVGYRALYSATSGASNVAVGSDALYSNVTGAENVAIGFKTLYSSTAGQSVAVGAYSQYNGTTGTTNSSLGYFSLYFLTTGTNNVAVGSQAARSTTTGINNTALGTSALYSNTQGNNNVAIGTSAAYAGQLVSGIVAIGRDALKDNTGSLNTAVGYNSQRLNTTGTANTSLGHQTLDENTTGAYNVALGWIALGSNTTGSHNISIGGGAGSTITTGNYNITIGRDANVSSASGERQIVIGQGTGKGDNTAYISCTNGAYNAKNVITWETTSDRRIKKNIVDNTQGLEVIEALAVRNFEYRTPEEIEELPSEAAIDQPGIQLGVIAQELQEVLPECVTENSTGVLSVNTDPLIWYLVNAVKQLSSQVKELQAQVGGTY